MASFTVTSNTDTDPQSLRSHLNTANTNAEVDTITFDLPVESRTIIINSELTISESLTIDGDLDDDGIPDITIDTTGNSRVLQIDNRSETFVEVTLEGLVITGGRVSSGRGGGIRNTEILNLNNSVISGNYTSGQDGDGGAIHNLYGTLTLNNTTVSGNSILGDFAQGGGIFSLLGTLTLNNSTVSGNFTDGNVGEGGGIYSRDGTLTLNNSTVSGNSTAKRYGYGGGIFSFSSTLNLNNTTVSGNSTSGLDSEGGGISGHNTYLSLQSSLISGNSAISAGDEIFTSGSTESIGTHNLFGHSGITRGDAFSGFDPDSGTANIIATQDGTQPTQLLNILLPLADNGGPTLTHDLPLGSPAINAGANPENFDTDQRGVGFIRQFGPATDIGAIEKQGIFSDGFEQNSSAIARSALQPASAWGLGDAAIVFALVAALLVGLPRLSQRCRKT